MPFIESILSRFTDSDTNEKEEIAGFSEKREPEARGSETPDSQVSGSEVPDSEVPDSQYDPSCLQLAADHPVNQLWTRRMGETGWMPAPTLRLAGPSGQENVLPMDEVRKELSRLLFAVSSTANKRLIKASATEGDVLSPNLDAEVVVFLTSGNLTAWLLVYPPMGKGKDVDRGMLASALKESKVDFGVMEELLDALPNDPERYFRLFLIARGEQPVHGTDGAVIDLYPRSTQRMAKVDEHGKMDYTELDLIQVANKGDVICRIIPPTDGKPGKSVLNQEIPSRNGRPAVVPKGRNTEISKDGYSLIASEAGRVEFSGRTFQVKPILEINGNVDYSTGNIHFLGDVQIHGDVCTGFNVRATGNVTVEGVVEACRVEAGGDLIIKKGVKGDDHATIQAHQSLYAKYLENCNVCARYDLQTECIINSNAYCDGQIRADVGRGIIIGGKVRASHTVSAKTVGTRSELRTIVGLGGLPSEEFDCECLREEIVNLETALDKLEHQPDNPFKMEKMPKVRMKLSVDKNKLMQYEHDLMELDLQEHEQGYDGQHLVCDIAYPGTEVTIGGITRVLDREVRRCTATLADGEIRLK